ncbi:MAG: SEC-C domain-containing protein [Sandaracinaceae bacterium]|nr:SEC-C domain-containing protein [Sandaracinaceae bacterium]
MASPRSSSGRSRSDTWRRGTHTASRRPSAPRRRGTRSRCAAPRRSGLPRGSSTRCAARASTSRSRPRSTRTSPRRARSRASLPPRGSARTTGWRPAPGERAPDATAPCPCGSGRRYEKCRMPR